MKPKIEIFKTEDFKWVLDDDSNETGDGRLLSDDVAELTAKQANQILSERLGPMVFSGPEKNYGTVEEEWHIANLEGYDTHRAYLIGIEEIK